MNFAARLIFGWLLFGVCAPAGATTQTGRTLINGIEYRRLDDWARSRGWQVRWTVPGKAVQVTGTGTTLAFEADSRLMILNGVNVHLNWPVGRTSGMLLIARQDIEKTLLPILSPEQALNMDKIATVVVDPGHGGQDPGNQEGTANEKALTLLLAKELSAQLAKAGYRVVLTRAGDSFVDLEERTALARKRGASLFVSLHFNSAGSRSGAAVRGAEVYCLTPARASSTNARGQGADCGAYPGNRNDSQNLRLAYLLQKSLVTRAGLADRGVRRARFAVLRNATMPAVLVEAGYLSNAAEARRIQDPAWRRQLAQAIVHGINTCKNPVKG